MGIGRLEAGPSGLGATRGGITRGVDVGVVRGSTSASRNLP